MVLLVITAFFEAVFRQLKKQGLRDSLLLFVERIFVFVWFGVF
jgi:hypothetical protein